jgi:diguanylate cyclase (GGDEF)-like protein/PAS domain S-box-containing protein
MHDRLARQLKRYFGSPEGVPESLADLVREIDQAYRDADEDLRLLERTMDVASGELMERHHQLRAEAAERRRAEEAVRESEERLRLVLEQTPAILWTLDRDLRITLAIGAGLAELGLTSDEMLGNHLFDYLRTSDPAVAAVSAHLRALAGETVTYGGGWRGRWYQVRVDPLRDRAGAVVGVIGLGHDVTERRRAEEALRESEIRFRTVVEALGEGLLITDADDRILYANPRVEEIFGYRPEELVGRIGYEVLLPADEIEVFRERIGRRLDGSSERYELRVRRKDGSLAWTEIHATPYRGPDGTVVGTVGAIAEITERKRVEEQLAHGALHDSLTGLPNRALFINRLEHALERLRRGRRKAFAVLFLDLDRFKLINDSLGHATGDDLLRHVGTRLEEALRPDDTVSRFGGDEFTILLDDVNDAVDASHVADRVLEVLARPFRLGARQVYTSASIGIALCASGDADPQELLRNADAALHRAKGHGKARYEVFDREMHAAAMLRLQMETDLRLALGRGEFRLMYQPVISLHTGRLVGFEALARWEHPLRGTIAPDDFIPVAEETGLIVPLGRWVVREACRALAEARPRAPGGRPLTLGVNVSARQFLQPDFVQEVEAALNEHGIPPESLIVEMTESVLVDTSEAVSATLERLKDQGVVVYVDDFGTGYSSLGYLHRFPVDGLKIDRSFVHGMEHDARKAGFVRAIVALGRNLSLRVVAEGVDDPAQLALLREMGCHHAQGYLFAKPLCPEAMERFMAEDPAW